MIQPLIYRYSPNNLNDFIMDNDLHELIRSLISMDNINLILYGNQGTGKTKLINCIINEYYLNRFDKNNILVINSLKEQGISYYRNEVKNFCQIMSTVPNKKKIVVLDDIDIINEQSQQVFRNCLDKYSNNVHFICSCNNIQKVIESIQSRLCIIKLRLLDTSELIRITNMICLNEKIMVSDSAIEFIIKISNRSISTIINYLEKFKLLNLKITEESCKDLCTNISFDDFISFTKKCRDNNLNGAIENIYNIFDSGYSVIDIFDNYFIFIKITEILDEEEKYKIIKFICKYITIFYNIHEDEIELALFTNDLVKIFK